MTLAQPFCFGVRHAGLIERSENEPAPTTAQDPYSFEWLLELHRGRYRTPDQVYHAGKFRDYAFDAGAMLNTIDGRAIPGSMFPAPDQVERLTRQMLECVRRQLTEARLDPLITGVLAALALMKIHPFYDGNGRTGRALWLHILRNHGFSAIDRMDVPGWIDRRREPYLAYLSIIEHVPGNDVAAQNKSLGLCVNWFIGVVTDAAAHAEGSVQTLTRQGLATAGPQARGRE